MKLDILSILLYCQITEVWYYNIVKMLNGELKKYESKKWENTKL